MNLILTQIKAAVTHAVSDNLILMLSTCRVVLHTWNEILFKDTITFIKERYSFTIISESIRRVRGEGLAELKYMLSIANNQFHSPHVVHILHLLA